jgi:hypothetical protein
MAEAQRIEIGKKKRTGILEKTRQRNIVKYLNAVPQCHAEVRTQTGYGTKGGADIFGCIEGHHFELEVKQPHKQPTPTQQYQLKIWESCGSIAGRVEDVETTRQLFKDYGFFI